MSIKGSKKEELTMESVLYRTTPLEIYSFYMPNKNWRVNEVTNSPFGEDRTPSFIIGNKYGEIGHYAFNDHSKRGDCFNFVKQLYDLPNLDTVLRRIDIDMNLGISSGVPVREGFIAPISEKKEVNKRNTLIQVLTRKFTKEELDYWAQYYQNIDDLRREGIYSINKAFLNKKPLVLDELRFGYLYENKYWKIYQPNKPKRGKWITNAPLVLMDGLENIKDCDTAWITKSKKDKMVLKKLYSCVASTQNESLACFSSENVEYIKKNSKKQVVLYDSDSTGVSSCQEITKKFDMGYCNVPKKYLEEEIKDFSDLARIHGLKAVEDILKEKGLI